MRDIAERHEVDRRKRLDRVDRGRFDASNKEWGETYRRGKKRVEAAEAKMDFKLMASYNHLAQFIDCIKSRQKTVTPIEVAHRSQTPGHLGYIASVVGRTLKWDAAKQEIVGDRGSGKAHVPRFPRPGTSDQLALIVTLPTDCIASGGVARP